MSWSSLSISCRDGSNSRGSELADEFAQFFSEVFDVAGELPVLQKTMREIADDERRRLPKRLSVRFAACFGRSFFLPF